MYMFLRRRGTLSHRPATRLPLTTSVGNDGCGMARVRITFARCRQAWMHARMYGMTNRRRSKNHAGQSNASLARRWLKNRSYAEAGRADGSPWTAGGRSPGRVPRWRMRCRQFSVHERARTGRRTGPGPGRGVQRCSATIDSWTTDVFPSSSSSVHASFNCSNNAKLYTHHFQTSLMMVSGCNTRAPIYKRSYDYNQLYSSKTFR